MSVIDIAAFERAARRAKEDGSLRLSGKNVCAVGWLRTAFTFKSAHARTAAAFLDALKAMYGEGMFRMAEEELLEDMRVGKPLTAIKVRNIIAEVRRMNDMLINFEVGMNLKTGEPLPTCLDEALAVWFAQHPVRTPPDLQEWSALRERIVAELRAGKPICRSIKEMYLAVSTGKVSPMREGKEAVTHLTQILCDKVALQRVVNSVPGSDGIQLEDDAPGLKAEIEARLSEATLGHTRTADGSTGYGLLMEQVEYERLRTLEDYVRRRQALNDANLSPNARHKLRTALFSRRGPLLRVLDASTLEEKLRASEDQKTKDR